MASTKTQNSDRRKSKKSFQIPSNKLNRSKYAGQNSTIKGASSFINTSLSPVRLPPNEARSLKVNQNQPNRISECRNNPPKYLRLDKEKLCHQKKPQALTKQRKEMELRSRWLNPRPQLAAKGNLKRPIPETFNQLNLHNAGYY